MLYVELVVSPGFTTNSKPIVKINIIIDKTETNNLEHRKYILPWLVQFPS
jgi:hypothetical protein